MCAALTGLHGPAHAQEVKPEAPAAATQEAPAPPASSTQAPAEPAPATPAPTEPAAAPQPEPAAQPAPAAANTRPEPVQPVKPRSSAPEAPGHPQPLAAHASVESWGWGKEPAWAATSSLRSHTGLSVRVGAGLGYARASRKLSSGSEKLGGLAGSLTLDIGAAAIEDLIIYGRLSGVAFNHASSSDTEHINGAYFLTLGAGARYYFMPQNWYAGATLSLAGIRVTNDEIDAQNAHPGFGFDLEAGKDWWIGTHYDKRSIGLALRFSYETCSTSASAMPRGKAWNGYAITAVFAVGWN
jgi:hypothetical protein